MEKGVLIIWIDSTSLSNTWEDEEKALEFIEDEFIVSQLGYILEETDKYILLCSRIGEFSQTKIKHYGDVFKIPKSCVLKIKQLNT